MEIRSLAAGLDSGYRARIGNLPKSACAWGNLVSSIAYRSDLDGIRAIAVIAVLLFHYQLGFAPGGFVGVDVFFVLSGFLMTAMLWPKPSLDLPALADFYERRARRIVPASYVVLLATAVF